MQPSSWMPGGIRTWLNGDELIAKSCDFAAHAKRVHLFKGMGRNTLWTGCPPASVSAPVAGPACAGLACADPLPARGETDGTIPEIAGFLFVICGLSQVCLDRSSTTDRIH